MPIDIPTIIQAFSSGGWGVAALFAYLYIAERRGARDKDAAIFKLLQKQLRLLGGKQDDED